MKPEQSQTFKEVPRDEDGKYRIVCELCDGTGILTYELGHSEYCIDAGLCIGRKFCPIVKEIKCNYCINGWIEFDYILYRVGWHLTFPEKVGIELRKGWRKRLVTIGKLLIAYSWENYACRVSPAVTKKQNVFTISTGAWSFEDSRKIILDLATRGGLPMQSMEKMEIMDVRRIYGIKEPYGNTKYYNSTMYAKYLEWLQGQEVVPSGQ